jgi:hypothetical protein
VDQLAHQLPTKRVRGELYEFGRRIDDRADTRGHGADNRAGTVDPSNQFDGLEDDAVHTLRAALFGEPS